MRRTLASVVLLLIGLLCLKVQADDLPLLGVGTTKTAAAAGYQGPGDLGISGVLFWNGLRGYTAASTGKVVQLCDTSGANCLDNNWSGSGFTPTNGTGACNNAGNVCHIRTLYDQSGQTNCTGPVACDLLQLTAASQPILVTGCTTHGHPCLSCVGGSQTIGTIGALTSSPIQPFSNSIFAMRTSGTGFSAAFASDGSLNVQTGFGSGANVALQFAGSVVNEPANDNAWHALQAVYAGGSSAFYVDGTPYSTSPGSSNFAATASPLLCSGSNSFTGDITENGVWSGSFSVPTMSAINSQQTGYW